ncbi:TVP38/TMEM64 family protein [Polyangium aurulentum]|uniref:TVP38/TMEM64 family protein n=1 Tax=Polyangium aurulentum TaxID=2567896 RepID=UPI0010AEE04C|nr:VTT domain-containing protein [Polyangium aurulentum]UQA56867.1 VTT domain-containing protein [Polyangium aurulentum]
MPDREPRRVPPSDPPPDPAASRTLRNLKIAAVAAVASGLVAAQRLGLFGIFSEPARIKQALVELGPWGYVAFVAAYAALQPFGVPGTMFILAAPLIWPWPVAFALSMAGTMAASVVGFSFARFVARDWVSKFVPARFRAYDEALEKRAFFTVFMLRLIFWMPPMLHVFFGISRVRFWTHFWGSLVGYILPLLATSYFGEKVFDAMRDAPPSTWIGLGAVMVIIVVLFWRFSRRSAEKVIPS